MVQGELSDVPRLVRVMKEYNVAQVAHTAAMSHPTLSLDFPMGTFAANVEGTLAVYEAARLANGRRVVNFSSKTVYGATRGRITEATPVKPSTPYAVTKMTTEWLGKVFNDVGPAPAPRCHGITRTRHETTSIRQGRADVGRVFGKLMATGPRA
jgi:UDP-glucose 4-epimerase